MKRNLLTLAAVGAIALGGFAVTQAQGWSGHRGHGFALEHLTKSLNLTSDQQAKVQPIIDQVRPQITTIRKDEMQKIRAVISNAMTQIRPILNQQQQAKFDALQKARQDMQNAQQELQNAMAQ
jgi:Spy/CpxP family protein refolding chaperone